jgi:hypothetical protein
MSRPAEKRIAIKNLSGLARAHTEKAIAVLVKAMDNEDERIAVDAASRILDRGYGKPAQSVELGSDPDQPLVHEIVRRIIAPQSGNPNG